VDPADSPFQPQFEQGRFRVVDKSGRIILDCGDRGSAEQYAALLNEAYRRGFKAGYRAARRA
jgi:hypothetical protein